MGKSSQLKGISIFKEGKHLIVKLNERLGVYNGYVGVQKGNRFYGKDYTEDSVVYEGIQVHGGVTYTGKGFDEEFSEDHWYIGFDTAHFGDYIPNLEHDVGKFIQMILPSNEEREVREKLLSIVGSEEQEFRDVKYVLNEVRKLEQQLK